MIARLIVFAEVRGGMKQNIATGHTRGELRHVAHVAGDEFDLALRKRFGGFLLGANQATNFVSLCKQCLNEISAEEAGSSSNKRAHKTNAMLQHSQPGETKVTWHTCSTALGRTAS